MGIITCQIKYDAPSILITLLIYLCFIFSDKTVMESVVDFFQDVVSVFFITQITYVVKKNTDGSPYFSTM